MPPPKFKKIKSAGLSLISGLALVFILWLLFFGKIKAQAWLTPLWNKIPKDETGLIKTTEDVLGEAASKLKDGTVQKAAEKGSEIFESSEYAEPARDIRETVKQRVNEVVLSVKELPAREINVIKRQVCKEWFEEEVATQSGGN